MASSQPAHPGGRVPRTGRPLPTALPERLVLFDGVCGLCNRSIQWLVSKDDRRVLRYAPLQGDTANRLRQSWPDSFPEVHDTVLFVDTSGEDVRILVRSRAVLAILRAIGRAPTTTRLLSWIPAPVLDLGYRALSVVRYRLFGQFDECRVPTPEERDLFLA